MPHSPFLERIERELAERRGRNGRYSLRAFASFLGMDHSSLGQMLRGARPVPPSTIRKIGAKLGLGTEEIAAYAAAEQAPGGAALARQLHLRHWTAEALAVVNEPLHYRVVELTSRPDFRADVRWIARETGSSIDAVNIVLQRLLRIGMLEMRPSGWTATPHRGEKQFRKQALDRIRQLAASYNSTP